MPACVVARLDQHETEVVVGFGEVGPQPDGLAERRRHLGAVRALAAEQQAQDVVRLGPRPGSAPAPAGARRSAPSQSGAGTAGDGRFSPASSWPSALSSVARREDR